MLTYSNTEYVDIALTYCKAHGDAGQAQPIGQVSGVFLVEIILSKPKTYITYFNQH